MGSAKGSQVQRPSDAVGRFDRWKWSLIFLLMVMGIVANYHYGQVAWAIRAAVGIVLVAVLVVIALQTEKGVKAFGFVKGARSELRKVVWPTRPETIQTTVIVVVMVIITALVLWGLDSLFMWLIGGITGQRG